MDNLKSTSNEINKQTAGHFINGKGQIVEMLQYMDQKERNKLLGLLKRRNPTLAKELHQQSFSFDHLDQLPNETLKKIFAFTSEQILGMALKSAPLHLQQKLLSLAPREYAKKAYSIMKTPIFNEIEKCKRAQQKILNTMNSLVDNQHINVDM